ncbi:MAG: ARMT1-like domain-containing protein, partial [Ruminococcus sp.]
MRVIESCAECLYNRQLRLTDNQAYLAEIRDIIDNRGQDATAPYLVYRFNQTYRKYFGRTVSYADVKKQYNDLVLSMEDALRGKINQSEHPLLTAFSYARTGNYIDFGAIRQVDEKTFLSLLERDEFSEHDLRTFDSFTAQCANADSLLLLADNSGEIVLDKLFLE